MQQLVVILVEVSRSDINLYIISIKLLDIVIVVL